MPTYSVEVLRMSTDRTVLEVTAEDEEAAELAAINVAGSNHLLEWELVDFDFEVEECTNLDEEEN